MLTDKMIQYFKDNDKDWPIELQEDAHRIYDNGIALITRQHKDVMTVLNNDHWFTEGMTEYKIDRLKDKKGYLQECLIFIPYELSDDRTKKSIDEYLEKNKDVKTVKGKVVLHRDMGKTGFVTVEDDNGNRQQIYVRKDMVSSHCFQHFKKVDMGQTIEAVGEMFTTKDEELTLKADSYTIYTSF